MHQARAGDGRPWRQMVYQVAPWRHPRAPGPGVQPPSDASDVRAPSRVQKRSFTQKTDDLAGALESLLPAQSWLYREASLGGRATLWNILHEELTSSLGSHWAALETSDLLEHLDSLPEWAPFLTSGEDLVLCHLLLDSLRRGSTRSCVLRCLVLVPCLVAIASVSVTTLSVDLSSTGCRRGVTNWQPNLSASPLWLSEPLLMLVTLGLICSWFSFCRDASTPRSWKPLPVTTRNYEDLLAATLDQGAGQPTAVQALAALKDYPTGPAAIHSVGHLGKPREDAPWIAPVQFTGSSVGRRLRELWADPHLGCVFSKGPNGWPARVSPKRSASDAADARRSRARR